MRVKVVVCVVVPAVAVMTTDEVPAGVTEPDVEPLGGFDPPPHPVNA